MRKRPLSTAIDRLQIELVRVKSVLADAQAMVEMKDSPFWQKIVSKVNNKLADAELSIDRYLDVPKEQVYALLEQRKILRYFRSIPEEMEIVISECEQKKLELENKINELASRINKNKAKL